MKMDNENGRIGKTVLKQNQILFTRIRVQVSI